MIQPHTESELRAASYTNELATAFTEVSIGESLKAGSTNPAAGVAGWVFLSGIDVALRFPEWAAALSHAFDADEPDDYWRTIEQWIAEHPIEVQQ